MNERNDHCCPHLTWQQKNLQFNQTNSRVNVEHLNQMLHACHIETRKVASTQSLTRAASRQPEQMAHVIIMLARPKPIQMKCLDMHICAPLFLLIMSFVQLKDHIANKCNRNISP